MIKKFFVSSVVLLSILFVSLNSSAKDNNQFIITSSFYGELGLGAGLVIDKDTQKATGVALNLAFGYMFTPYFGIEIGALVAVKNIYFENNFGDRDYVTAEKFFLPIAAKFKIPLYERLSLITKIGGQYVELSIRDRYDFETPVADETGLFTGVGLSYIAADEIDINITYQGRLDFKNNDGVLSLSFTCYF